MRRTGVESDLRSLIYHISRACKYINFALRAGHTTGYAGSENAFGEDQLALDVLGDKIILNELKKSELCAMAASEEQEHPVHFAAPRGTFSVAFDPLDGSSLFDANLSIGSIFGIWEGDDIVGQRGSDQVASVYCLYGPQVILVLGLPGAGTHMLEMNDVGEFMLCREHVRIAETGKYFAPGNIRATNENAAYNTLINGYMKEGKTLRYSGGMVPDLHHILAKGNGIFAYPEDTKNPTGKLRLAFECAPMALLFEGAGGAAITTAGQLIRDIKIMDIHQRTPIVIGSKTDVDTALKVLQG